MSPVLRSYIVGGLFLVTGACGIGYLASYFGAKHVDGVIQSKLEARESDEDLAARQFDGLRKRDPSVKLSDLEAIAYRGYPRAGSLLAWSYDHRAMVKERDALIMNSLNRMIDPDLLLFLGFVSRTFDEQARDEAFEKLLEGGNRVSLSAIYASMQTDLSAGDLETLKICYAKLQKTYSDNPHGRQAIRFAYFSDTMSCRTEQGLHDADQAGTRG